MTKHYKDVFEILRSVLIKLVYVPTCVYLMNNILLQVVLVFVFVMKGILVFKLS